MWISRVKVQQNSTAESFELTLSQYICQAYEFERFTANNVECLKQSTISMNHCTSGEPQPTTIITNQPTNPPQTTNKLITSCV